jgi:hypothetical protein
MDMKLDISRLKSQKELMKQATEGDKFGVYAYLREDGTPYYIGKMKDERRAFSRQHNAKPPPRGHEHRVRLLRGNLTEQEAFDWERRYIARYGRKNNGTGILRNLTDGGEGASGAILPASARATISRKAKERLRDPLKLEAQREKARLAAEIQLREKAKKLGIPFDEYAKMTPHKRAALGAIARRGKKYGINEADWLKLSPEQRQAYGRKAASVPRGISEKTVAAAKRHGMTIEQWNSLTRSEQLKANKRLRDGMTDLTGDLSDNVMKNAAAKYQISLEKWKALSLRDRNIVAQRYAKGVRGAALIDQRDPMMMKAAEKYQIPYERWVGLTAKERSLVKDRFIRGQRGDDLLADFGMSGGDVRLKKKAESLGFSFEFWKGLTDRQRNSINARNRRTGLRGKALLEGLL